MAEAIGLTLGVIGVAGVIGAFKDAIDLFGLIRSAKDYNRECQVLEIKLDIEKTLLLQWATRVRLLRPNYDRRLDDETTRALVYRTLQCIENLFLDTKQLKARYGLVAMPLVGFTAENGSTQARYSRQDIVIKNRMRWIIQDQQKFTSLIGELDYFIDKLNQVIPMTDRNELGLAENVIMAQEDLKTMRDLNQLKFVIEASSGFHDAIAETAKETLTVACQEYILNKLWFRRMQDRKESVEPAHELTFRWALEPPQNGVAPWDDLSAWLCCSSGVYWISGKAGSGKSTLIKYIYTQPKTKRLLASWAGESPLHIHDFFFAHLGIDEQKSTEGFFRSLLFQFFSNHRGMISKALPAMWKEVHDSRADAELVVSLPSPAENDYAWKIIASEMPTLGKFCIFIDGLDELAGDNTKAVSLIKTLAQSENVKIVVSSRPIPDCVAAFSAVPRLQLQDLTNADIYEYVQDVIGRHDYVKILERRYPKEVDVLKMNITEKASGVFLWVILACKCLLRGFGNHDRIHELRRAVDDLPPELEVLFQHKLSKVSKQHREQGSRLLRICHAHHLSPGSTGDVYSLGLALVEDYHLEPVCVKSLGDQDKRDLCEELEGRVRSRCDGLLEISRPRSTVITDLSCLCGAWMGIGHDTLIDSRVRFMHRTVFEFLCTDGVWDLDCLAITEDGFRVASALSIYGLQLAMQSLNLHLPQDSQAAQFLFEGAKWAAQDRDAQHEQNSLVFFENLQPVLRSLSQTEISTDGGSLVETNLRSLWRATLNHEESLTGAASILFAVTAGDVYYVRQHPERCALAMHQRHHCVCPSLLYTAICHTNVPNEMIRLLLSSGSDPNETIDASENILHLPTTPWLTYIDRFLKSDFSTEGNLAFLNVLDDFVRAGADLSITKDLERSISDYFIDACDADISVKEKALVSLQLLREMRDEIPQEIQQLRPRKRKVLSQPRRTLKRKKA